MKNSLLLAFITASSFLLASCSNEEIINIGLNSDQSEEQLNGICVTLPQSPFELTRVSHTVDASGINSAWQLGDTLGIYPVGGDQVAFPISDGAGTNSAKFNGGSWALRSTYNYAAYYPFSRSNVFVRETELAFDYNRQEQIGEGTMEHLSAYDFLAAGATTPDKNGNVDLSLNHLGCFVRFQLTIPEANTLKTLRLASNNAQFVTKGKVDLSRALPAIVPTATSSYVELNLKDFETENAGDVITLYMMLAPVDLSGSILTFTVYGNSGATYSQTLNTGKNMAAGNAYNYALSLDKEDSQYVAVDLGLPSGLKWASFNVGATAPEEYGDYYAWGEVVTKSRYEVKTYQYYHIVKATDADGIETEEPVWDDLGDISGTDYDVAHLKWGGSWRMPTDIEMDELCKYCTSTWGQKNGVYGCKVTGPNGNWIFLPAGGIKDLSRAHPQGYYWASTINYGSYSSLGKKSIAHSLFFEDTSFRSSSEDRDYGLSVRPVTE